MKSTADQGMTLLEVMVSAVMLAIFMAAFVAIMQLSAKLIKGVDSGGFTASELALARSIATERLNGLASSLAREEPAAFIEIVGATKCLTAQAGWNLANDGGRWSLSNQQLSKELTGTEQRALSNGYASIPQNMQKAQLRQVYMWCRLNQKQLGHCCNH